MILAPDGNRIAILGSSRYSQSVVGLLLNIYQVTSLSRNGHVMLKSQSKDNKKMQTNQKVTQNQGPWFEVILCLFQSWCLGGALLPIYVQGPIVHGCGLWSIIVLSVK